MHKSKNTILVGTEGSEDKIFCDYIKSLYYDHEQAGYIIRIFSMYGGSPKQTVSRTILKRDTEGYDKAYSIVDIDRNDHTDPNNLKEAIKHARINGIILIKHEPLCLDGMLLNIVEEKIPHTSLQCKSKLEKICGENRFSINSLNKNFPKYFLDKRRKIVRPLDELINLFTGSF